MEQPPPVAIEVTEAVSPYRAEPAVWESRLAAYLIDSLILAFLDVVAALLLLAAGWSTGVTALALTAANCVYLVIFWTGQAATPGKMAAGIRIVRVDGRDMDFATSLIRLIGYFISSLTLGLGFLWATWDPDNQALHDKIASTMVVYERPRQRSLAVARFVAYLIDWVLVGVVLLPLRLVGDQVVTEVLSFVIYAAYLITFWAYRGATPGKMALGLRVVRQDGEDVDVSVAALRFVGYMVSGIVLGLGFLWVVCDSNNEGWHDKIAKTRVIHVAR